ncbi:hypothetical protein FRB99_004953 [Tulasnella sp. 403]|nr:hypothetical protein FRB99_004953 [Tulasnella sp. 403]
MAFPERPRTPQPPQASQSGLRTPPDQEMVDQGPQAQPSPRPTLPSATSDFALSVTSTQAQPFSSSAPASPSTSLMAIDDPMSNGSPFGSPSASSIAWNYMYNYQNGSQGPFGAAAAHTLLRKLRRPSLLGLGGPGATSAGNASPSGLGSRMNSPLVSSFTSPFAFEAPSGSGSSSGTGSSRASSSRLQTHLQRAATQVEEEEEEYTPVLLTYEPSSSRRQRDMDRDPVSTGSTTASPRKHKHRVSRSMSPSTPPPRLLELGSNDTSNGKNSTLRRPTSMLRRSSSSSSLNDLPSSSRVPQTPGSGLSQQRPLAIPRLRNIISESNAAEIEVKSEAKFRRFVASHAEIPAPFKSYPRTPRSRAGSTTGTPVGGMRTMVWPTERGRFPEEACVDDEEIDEDDSADSEDLEQPSDTGGAAMSLTEEGPLSISFGGGLSIHRGSSGSLGGMLESPAGMDVDVAMGSWISASPPISIHGGNGNGMSMSSGSTPNLWRHTPPPTAAGSSNRVGKRKLEDRYEPYPAAKRRAVSPAISISPYHSHPSLASPITLPRSPITVSRPLPMSTTSSPVLRPVVRLHHGSTPSISGGAAGGGSGGIGLMGMGGTLGIGVGPNWNNPGGNATPKSDEKEVTGAGDGVGSLRL